LIELFRFFQQNSTKCIIALRGQRNKRALLAQAMTQIAPELCRDMSEVRAGVDALDQQIVTLIAQRFGYMDAAARIKEERSAVRDEARKAEVLANVRRAALDQRIPQDVVAQIWEALVEGSIAYELDRWDGLRG
jgi:isochorismate pyruvate lyase